MGTWREYLKASKSIGRQDLAAAATHFEHMLAVDPEHWAALMMLGYRYEALDRDRDALAIGERALLKDPYDFRALQLAGRAAARMEDHLRARPFVERALGIDPPPDHLPSHLYGLVRTVIGLPVVRRLFRKDALEDLDPSAHQEELARWKQWARDYIAWLDAEDAKQRGHRR